MTQALFDALAGIDGSGLGMQSLLEATPTSTMATVVQDPNSTGDEDDIFQCGKCKKQFSSLASFMSHKREHCMASIQTSLMNSAAPQLARPQPIPATLAQSSINSAFSVLPQTSLALGKGFSLNTNSINSMGAVPPSPLAQLPTSMVLGSDEVLISQFANVEQNIQQLQNTLLNSGSLTNAPFLTSQAASRLLTSTTPVTSCSIAGSSPMQPTLNIGQVTNIQIVQPGQISLHQTIQNQNQADQTNALLQHHVNQHQQHQHHQQTQALLQPASIMTQQQQSHQQQRVQSSGVGVQEQLVRMAPMVQAASDTDPLSRPDHIYSLTARRKRRNGPEQKKPGKLRCNYCENTYSKNFDLQQHLRSHTGEKPFQCIVCGRAFAQKSNVKKHMQTHKVWPDGKPHTLPNKPIMKVANIGDENSAKNAKIRLDAGGSQDLLEPIPREELFVDNSYVCNFCDCKFKTYYQLKTHMRDHKDEQLYKCILKTCTEAFKDLEEFLDHIRSHDKELNYRCHLCNKQFTTLNDLGVHQYSHSLYPNQGPKSLSKEFKCAKCHSKYSSPEALEHHLSTSSHSFSCPECGKVFTCERHLRRHLVSHSTQPLYECDFCHKKLKSEHYLKSHLLIHTGQKPFSCPTCGTEFNRKDKLKRHMLVHEPTKRFKCPFASVVGCPMAFNRADKLKAHIISHSGIKPFKCLYCAKMFSRKPNLVEHMKLHTNDFPFRCQQCNKGFSREKYLGTHKCNSRKGPKRTELEEAGTISLELAAKMIDDATAGNPPEEGLEVRFVKPGRKKRARNKKEPSKAAADKDNDDDEEEIRIVQTKTRQVRMRTSAFLNKPKRMRKPKTPRKLTQAELPVKASTITLIEEDLAIIQNVLANHSGMQATDEDVDAAMGELTRDTRHDPPSLTSRLTHRSSAAMSLPSESLIQDEMNLAPGDLSGQTVPVSYQS